MNRGNCIENLLASVLEKREIFEWICLDADSECLISNNAEERLPNWTQIDHCNDKRSALILRAMEVLSIEKSIYIECDFVCFIRYAAGLPSISSDGLSISVRFIHNDGLNTIVHTAELKGGKQHSEWYEVSISLNHLIGELVKVEVECHPGPDNDPTADWLAIAELCISRKDKVGLVLARTFPLERSRNEIQHFQSVYEHFMYSSNLDFGSEQSNLEVKKLNQSLNKNKVRKFHSSLFNDISELRPTNHESAYAYAHRLLGRFIVGEPPNFLARLEEKSSKFSRLRVLSLLSGGARIEASWNADSKREIEWTLIDINEHLLIEAAKKFGPLASVELIEANVNNLHFFKKKWDVILCISGIHHVVELERLIEFCHSSLEENGELWLIGENVGKNGNKLWPDALDAVNNYFKVLPEKYRLNRYTNTVDIRLPNLDYSVGCFEGIRSEDIESSVAAWIDPIHIYKRNAFLWRILDLAYLDNYDLSLSEDLDWIRTAVEFEYYCYSSGMKGTELHSIYKKRNFL